jgi:glycosyltransferase involved in cell wall biosynthesis
MKNKKPLVSILIATYNRAQLLNKAIKSVLEQSLKNWEIIICDDASTDNTETIVKKWKEKIANIKYLKNRINLGVSKSSNRGLKTARGKYIAILDDDDCWLDKNKLKKQINFLKNNPEYIGCGGGVIVVDKNNKELYRYLKPETDKEIRKYILFSNPMANTTTVFRKNSAEKIGLYDENLRYSADRDFWMKMGKIGKLYNFSEYFAYYLMSGENTSIVKIKPHLKNSLFITKRYKGDYPSYRKAIIFNYFQYCYSFVPSIVRKLIHKILAQLKRKLFK